MGIDSRRSARGQSGAATSRAEFVYMELRDSIRTGEIKPGQRLRETEVAEQLGVSRTPVREALKRLESEGLAVFASPRGLVVAELDQQQVLELYAVRETMEGLAAKLAAQHASDAEIGALRDLLRRESELPATEPQTLAQINRHLHQVIYHAAHNRYLLDGLNSIRDAEALLRSTTFAVSGRPASALLEHTEIVNAIERRDPDAAEAVARHHIRNALRARLELLFTTFDGSTIASEY